MPSPRLSELPDPPAGKTGWPWTEESGQIPETMPDGSPWPKISIVTPSYNQGQFIEETIRSVLLQGYPNLEYIIMDGASTDGSVEIVKKYAPWLTYWTSEPDAGQSWAINAGWQRGTGDILAWVNSDDLLMPNTLQSAAGVFHSNKDAGFVHGIGEHIDEHSKVFGTFFGSEFDLEATLVSSENYVAQPSTFISRQALDRVGFLNCEFHVSMDWDLWLRIGAYFPAVYVRQVWSRIRNWEGSKASTIGYLSGAAHVQSVKDLFKNHPSSPVFSDRVKRKALASAYWMEAGAFYMQANYHGCGKSLVKSLWADPSRIGRATLRLLQFLLFTRRLHNRNWRNKTANASIIRLGSVELPLAVVFDDAGLDVTGIDLDERKFESSGGN
jgi:glycosyltransferase involved in cell wall biosynthesis